MCGRYTLRTPMKDVAELFDLGAEDFELLSTRPARYNIAPTQEVLAIRALPDEPGRHAAWLHWGLVPPWADDSSGAARLINARSETAAVKPTFREPFRHRRCLIPVDGFYEWKRTGKVKQPYYIRLQEDGPFAFAGLWQQWRRNNVTIESCTILTTEANELLRPLHDRMPVILDPRHFDLWLDLGIEDPRRLEPLLAPYPAERMTTFPIETLVNSPRNDSPQCIAPAAPGKVQTSLFD